MQPESGTFTFVIPEPFDRAVRRLQASVESRGLRITLRIDLSQRVMRTLGIHLPPCLLLGVWPGEALAADLDPVAAVLLPLHLVLASRDGYTEIFVRSRIRPEDCARAGHVRSGVIETQKALLQSLDAVAMRPGVV